MIRLSVELSVAESTLYKWQEDIIEIALYAAIEYGLVSLFGLRAEKELTEGKAGKEPARD